MSYGIPDLAFGLSTGFETELCLLEHVSINCGVSASWMFINCYTYFEERSNITYDYYSEKLYVKKEEYKC